MGPVCQPWGCWVSARRAAGHARESWAALTLGPLAMRGLGRAGAERRRGCDAGPWRGWGSELGCELLSGQICFSFFQP